MCRMVAKWIYLYIYLIRSVSRYLGVETETCFKWLQNGYIFMYIYFVSGAFPVILVWKQQHVSNGCKMEIFFFRSVSRYLGVETATCFKWLQNGYIYIYKYVSIRFFSGAFPVILVWKQQHVSNGCKMDIYIYIYIYMYIYFVSGAFPVILVWKQQHVSNGCKMDIYFFRSVSRYLGVETATCFKWLPNGYIYIYIYICFFRSVSRSLGVETATCVKWLQNGYIYIYIFFFPERFPLSWCANSNMCQMVAKWIYIYIHMYI